MKIPIFSSGLLVLFLCSATICENSARHVSESDEEHFMTHHDNKENKILGNCERDKSVHDTDSTALLDNVYVTTNINIYTDHGSTKSYNGDEENVSVSELVSEQISVTHGNKEEQRIEKEDGEDYVREVDKIRQERADPADTEIIQEENRDFMNAVYNSKSNDDSETNATNDNTELVSSEVQVEDFMQSRVAYHNALLADINKAMSVPSSSTSTESKNAEPEQLGTPEKLTMEETIGDVDIVPKGNKNTEAYMLQNTNVDHDLNLGNLQFLDKPVAYKLTMDNEDQIEESAESSTTQVTEIYNKFNINELMLTTDPSTEQITLTSVFEEDTSEPSSHSMTNILNVSLENDSLRNSNLNVTENVKLEDGVLKSETEVEKGITNKTESFGNGPVAERYYAFEIGKENKGNNLNNKLEDRTETNNRPMTHYSSSDHLARSEEDLVDIENLLPDHPSFNKNKIEPGILFEECTDCDFRILPIRPSEQRDAPKMEEESLPSSNIRFPDLPEGRELQIYSLGLSDGFFLFGYLSEFLSWIQPNEFPVELLRDALRSQITWISLITQSVQVEAGFVACLVVGVLFALAVPVVVLSHACYRMTSRDDDTADDKVGWAGNCRRRTLVFILQILLVLLLAGMVAMFVTNEQLSDAVVKSSDVIQTSLSDVSAFVHNSHLQIHFLVTQSLDQALQAVYADLDNVDTLLGRPIQRELVRETGIDVALESLADLTREAKQTTQQVDRLLDEVRVVQEMVISTREKLSDLRQQVELFRRACGPRDRALCDTIDASGLDVTLRLDRLKSDERLHRMRRMGGVGIEAAASEAKERFMSVPSKVEGDTRDAREAARRQLMRQRADVDDRSIALERLVRDMTSKVNEAKYQAGFWMQDLDQFEYWRWIVCMGGGTAVLMVWTLLLCSLCCGCCGSEKAAGPTILLTIVLVCLLSTALWLVALVGMVFGGHGEVFVCRPLYDEPDYHMISRLVDQPGVFYSEQKGGFIANVIYGNDTLDVPIRQVLEDCRENRALYPTLGLGRVFDVEASVDQHRWLSVSMQLRSVRANLSSLEVLSPELQDQLSDLLATLSVNFTEHRIQMSRPVTGKDMDSFARQLDNIGNQMRDLATASRMETLSTRTRRLIDSHIKPLESRKDALVYQLTALEVQTGPLQRQVNQSLSHLKTIQFFLNSQGEAIAQRKSRQYVDRLMGYVEQLRRHVVDAVSTSVAPCRPLWDIFNMTRLFLCRHTMDPLNGYWFASMWCLIVLLVATPVCLKLVDYYRARGYRSSGSPTENLMISEQGTAWSSPGYDIKYSKDEYNGNGHCKQ